MKHNTIYQATIERIKERKVRSAWDKGVKVYAIELAEYLEVNAVYYEKNGYPINPDALNEAMLNGAYNWNQYSWGGCAEIYDGSIAERLCTPSELKRTCYCEKKPNNREKWLDTQARALEQAARIVRTEYRTLYTMR